MKGIVHRLFVRGFAVIFLPVLASCFFVPTALVYGYQQQQIASDSIPPDSVKVEVKDSIYRKTRRPTFQVPDRFGDPFTNRISPTPLQLKNPSLIKLDIELDSGLNYTIFEKMGDINYRPTTYMTFDEYLRFQETESKKEYWRQRSLGLDGESAVSGRSLLPPLYTSPAMDRIFGGSFVEIIPNGFVTLDFGGRTTRNENPDLPIRQQRYTTFNFDQQINMNVVGKVGEKLEVLANFDNNNTFSYQNNLKVEYTGFDEDIIKKIEIGNVSMPMNNSLISGAQSLFGIKTQMQFGKLWVTSVATTQRGRSESLEIEGGAQGREFEVRASDYDENRHFFLGHFFRDNYERWLNNLPQITSGVNITRVEVFVINRSQSSESLRTIAAFMDLAEGKPEKVFQQAFRPSGGPANPATNNEANPLWGQIRALPKEAGAFESSLTGLGPEQTKTVDFELVNVARLLDPREYTFHRQLGYLSLQRALQNDELLAVAYEYTYNGQTYQVGELTEDYGNRPNNQVVLLKLLRPSKINVNVPTWDLMMKNIYNLSGTQITREGFQMRVIYRDDRTGQDNPSLHESTLKDLPLLRLMNLDSLNQQNDPQPDGNFDFVEGITMDAVNGRIIFPILEPFGAHFESLFQPFESNFIEKYVFRTLYRSTKNDAQQETTRDKFFLRGRYQAGSATEILLEGINISEGSVNVTAGGMPLQEGIDYRVDYNFGRVTILNEGILASGKPIRINYEKEDMFNFQARSLLGTRFDYRFSDDINIGATVLRHLERPIITRNSIGSEPMKNTKWGADFSFRKEVPFLTKMVDFLPFIDTKEMSMVTFHGEFAQLIPGTSNIVDGEGVAYIDDFEDSAIPYDLGSTFNNWRLASTPKTANDRFEETGNYGSGYKRAKVAWYIVDNVFYRNTGPGRPQNLPDKELENHYVRLIQQQELFKRRDVELGTNLLPVFDIAYYPEERGPYNYNPNLRPDGKLPDPRNNWGGISRAITSDVDFDKNNIEYIEFWMMDPFIQGPRGIVNDGRPDASNNTTGGKLIFNLGNVSEDVIPDGKLLFENGLPSTGNDRSRVDETPWGLVPNTAPITNAFDNSSPESRANQDVGYDGLKNEDERTKFSPFLSSLTNLNSEARTAVEQDPSADDFRFYLGDDLDQEGLSILQRYKKFNNPDGNTPLSSANDEFIRSGTRYPDTEDLNNDNTLQTLEEYYEYELDLRPGELQIGRNNIVDEVTSDVDGIKWYLFRIPVRNPSRVQGNISDFKTIRFVRTYLTGFDQPVVLRMARFRLIGSQWRRYEQTLQEPGLEETREQIRPNFVISVVNIEENSDPTGDRVPYVLPPGFRQDRDVTSILQRRLNEQSLQLCVEDLDEKDAVSAFKNVGLDLVQYGRLKMFLHAQGANVNDGDVTGFIRLGSDPDQNYYEIEVPLKITPYGSVDPRDIWPEENEIDLDFNELYAVKAIRNRVRGQSSSTLPFSEQRGKYRITIRGRPELSTVNTIMIGIRNPSGGDQLRKSVCMWANEMRVTDFDETAGWAANATLNTRLADLANITASTRYTSVGFGGIQQKISERTRESTTDIDVSANVNLDKFFPEKWGLQLPMFVSYSTFRSKPFFDPRDADIPLIASIERFATQEEKDAYLDIVTDQMVRRSINFTNVRRVSTNQDRWKTPINLENFSATFAYSDVYRSNLETESYVMKNYRAGLGYNYAFPAWEFRPLENVSLFASPYLSLLKDFNFRPVPNDFNARMDVNRDFVRTQLRNDQLTTVGMEPFFEKNFNINRIYGMNWSITENLSLNYRARAFSVIDELPGDINTPEKMDSLMANLRNLGRMKTFDQNIEANYRVPLDKFPLTDWISVDTRLGVGYNWMAGSLNQIDSLGNTIQNSRETGFTGRVDMTKLYNKVKLLNQINNPPRLKRDEVDTTWINQPQTKFIKKTLITLMALKAVNFTYTVREGTMLPGFRPRAFLFGLDSGFAAPGIPFLLGSQDNTIRFTAAENNWLGKSQSQTMPFTQSRIEDMNVMARIEPFKDLNIQLTARRTTNGNYQENFLFNNDLQDFVSLTPSRTGSYSISTFTLRTAFVTDNADNESPLFQQFERNREIIKQRLEQENVGDGFYELNAQDVLIPAFLAAYAGTDVNEVGLSAFPRIPLPNWRIDYGGLGKIPALQKIFSAVDISHAYTSSFDAGNFVSSLKYNEGFDFNNSINDIPFPTIQSDSGNWLPLYVIGQVIISERFAPLIGINVRTKSRLTGRFEVRRERNMALSTQNSQLTEMRSNDYVMDIGFTKANMKLPFKAKGRTIVLKNDLTFRFGFTIRDTKTIQRTLDTNNNVPVNGNLNYQIRPTLNYVLNQKLNLDLYFERSINEPIVLVSNRTSTTAFGVRVRFSLAQ